MNLASLGDRRLGRAFYARDALVVAKEMVGAHLVNVARDGSYRVVRIVETEAYRGPTDGACHARFGVTKRTRVLFGPPGHAYVFLIYGMYDCFNAVCLGEGQGHAVLVRGGEPVHGFEAGARGDGPGRLTRALGVTRVHDDVDLVTSEGLFLAAGPRVAEVGSTARVGVAYAGEIAEEPWRFFDRASAHVSRPSPRTIGLGVVTPAEMGAPRPRDRSPTSPRRRPSGTSPGTRRPDR